MAGPDDTDAAADSLEAQCAPSTVLDMVRRFEDTRRENELHLYRTWFVYGVRAVAAAGMAECMTQLLLWLDWPTVLVYFYAVIASTMTLSAMMCFVVVPLHEIDVESILRAAAGSTRAWVLVALFVSCAGAALKAPSVHILTVSASLVMLRRPPVVDYETFCNVWLIVDVIANLVHFVYVTLGGRHLVELELQHRPYVVRFVQIGINMLFAAVMIRIFKGDLKQFWGIPMRAKSEVCFAEAIMWVNCMGWTNLCEAFFYLSVGNHNTGMRFMLWSIVVLTAPAILSWVGRHRLYSVMSRRFGRQHGEEDGAFIAELLAASHAQVGEAWWVRLARPRYEFPATDHRRNWEKGIVSLVDPVNRTMVVQLPRKKRRGSRSTVHPQMVSLESGSGSSHSTGVEMRSNAGSPEAVVQAATAALLNQGGPPCHRLTAPEIGPPTAAPSPHTPRSPRWLGRARVTPFEDLTSASAEIALTASPPASTADIPLQRAPPPSRAHASAPVATGAGENAGSASSGSLDQLEMATNFVTLPFFSPESSAELLGNARKNLRCVPWEHLSMELVDRSASRTGPESLIFELSRPLKPGERIDFFLSHSWHDEASIKWASIIAVAEDFFQKHDRYPTFWLDKVCIDQNNLTDSLRAMCVNVMACNKILVLCGPTFPQRLWCAWELFTLFAFQRREQAKERIDLIVMQPAGESESLLTQLAKFDVGKTRCWDPNEERLLMGVIRAISETKFNECIRALGNGVRDWYQNTKSFPRLQMRRMKHSNQPGYRVVRFTWKY